MNVIVLFFWLNMKLKCKMTLEMSDELSQANSFTQSDTYNLGYLVDTINKFNNESNF